MFAYPENAGRSFPCSGQNGSLAGMLYSAKPLHSKMSGDIFECLECRLAVLCTQREFAFAKFSLVLRILPQRGINMKEVITEKQKQKSDAWRSRIPELIRLAGEAQANAYAPYSHYRVGAALLCGDGTVVKGCNIENASYGATNCAERTALFAAVAQGKRSFVCLALVAGPESGEFQGAGEIRSGEEPQAADERESGESAARYPSPCGICRQALREFVNPSGFPIIMARTETDYRIRTLEDLLPDSFGPEDLA